VLGGAETVLGLTTAFQPLESQRCLFRVDKTANDRTGRDAGMAKALNWRIAGAASG